MSQVLYITRGLPGSGKTTRAMAWVAQDPDGRVRAGRDPIRRMLHGGRLGTPRAEELATVAQLTVVTEMLRAGVSVIVDDTNLHDEHVARLAAVAAGLDVAVQVCDLTWVPLQTCIERDSARPEAERVGEAVIIDMHRRWTARKSAQPATG